MLFLCPDRVTGLFRCSHQIKSINEQHDGVTAKLLSYEELLTAKNEELSKLKKESGQAKARLSEMQSEGETIAILRAQVRPSSVHRYGHTASTRQYTASTASSASTRHINMAY